MHLVVTFEGLLPAGSRPGRGSPENGNKSPVLILPTTHQEPQQAEVSNSRRISWFLRLGIYMNWMDGVGGGAPMGRNPQNQLLTEAKGGVWPSLMGWHMFRFKRRCS